jgi:hypothetical protein
MPLSWVIRQECRAADKLALIERLSKAAGGSLLIARSPIGLVAVSSAAAHAGFMYRGPCTSRPMDLMFW